MTPIEITTTTVAVASVLATLLSWLRANAAVKAAREANDVAREANTFSKEANALSKEANAISREANDISREGTSLIKAQHQKRLAVKYRWDWEIGLTNQDREGIRQGPLIRVEVTNLGPEVFIESVAMMTDAKSIPLEPSASGDRGKRVQLQRGEPKRFQSRRGYESEADWDSFRKASLLLVVTTCGERMEVPIEPWCTKMQEPFSAEESDRIRSLVFESDERRANWQPYSQ